MQKMRKLNDRHPLVGDHISAPVFYFINPNTNQANRRRSASNPAQTPLAQRLER